MDQFICKHGEAIHGALSCFDRMLFRGYLPIMSGAAMADFLQAKGVQRVELEDVPPHAGRTPQEARDADGGGRRASLPVPR
jgi:hypothetical protein